MADHARIAGIDVDTRHWIGGERIASPERFPVFSPIDGEPLAEVSAGSARDAEAAVQAAREAFPHWAALGPAGRRPILERLANAILARIDDLSAVETRDNGSLLIGNRRNVMARCAHNVAFFAELACRMEGEVIAGDTVDNHVRYEPSGAAALITPWNAPLMLGTWKVGPALAAGNTVVLKPPEWAPLTCSMLADLAAGAGLPAGVLNVLQGTGEEAGAALAAHPDLARLSFTGSPATARRIGRATAESLTPVSFELGGKSPFIVFADADLDAAARTIARQYVNAGQVCLAGTRVLAEAKIAAPLLEKVRAETGRLPVGDPRDPATRIGPLIHPRQHERVSGYVERALSNGARTLLGGETHPFGALYYRPTLLAGAVPGDEIFDEEVFGPVLTWNPFGDEAEALTLANATRYGLAAMVYTGDPARAERVAAGVVAGTVWVNCYFVRDLAAPFGGARISGIGREGGRWSFDFFCDVKNVAIRRDGFGSRPARRGS